MSKDAKGNPGVPDLVRNDRINAQTKLHNDSKRVRACDSRLAIDGHSTHGPHLLHLGVLRCLSQDSTLHTTPNVFLPLIVANINHFPCHRPYRRAKRIRIDSRHRLLSRQDRRFHALCRTSPLCIAVIPLLGLSQRRPFQYSSLSTRSWISISNKLISTTTTTTKFGKLHSEGTQSLVDVELNELSGTSTIRRWDS